MLDFANWADEIEASKRPSAPTPSANDEIAGLARTLATSCPDKAHGFALAMHETACIRGDFHHAALWLAVLDTLSPRPDSARLQSEGPGLRG
jgi:hypothetical protein